MLSKCVTDITQSSKMIDFFNFDMIDFLIFDMIDFLILT